MAQHDPFADPQLSHFYGGYIPTPPDQRDFLFPRLLSPQRAAAARTNHDLRQWNGQSMCMPVGDQLQEGSCTAWAWGYELRGMLTARWRILNGIQANLNDTMAARFVYDIERGPEFMNTYPQDSGADMRSGGAVLLKYGCAPEGECPYTGKPDNGPLSRDITQHVKDAAAFYGISAYFQLQGTGSTLIDSILQCLDEGYPAVIAILVGNTFENCPGSGKVGVPAASETVLGGHAITVVGNFMDSSAPGGGYLIVQNHWGKGWGAVNDPDTAGFCYLPFQWASVRHPQYGYWLSESWTAR